MKEYDEEECYYYQYVWRKCERGSWTKFPVRCRLYEVCDPCRRWRVRKIVAKALSRYENLQTKPKTVTMWTFGTSVEDTPIGRKEVSLIWKTFTHRLRTNLARRGIKGGTGINMWTLEAGTKGKRLHIHAIVFGFRPHALYLDAWRSITGEASNVNYTSRRGKPNGAFRYIAKYAGKNAGRYYFSGGLLASKEAEAIKKRCTCGSDFVDTVSDYIFRDRYQHEMDGRLDKGCRQGGDANGGVHNLGIRLPRYTLTLHKKGEKIVNLLSEFERF